MGESLPLTLHRFHHNELPYEILSMISLEHLWCEIEISLQRMNPDLSNVLQLITTLQDV